MRPSCVVESFYLNDAFSGRVGAVDWRWRWVQMALITNYGTRKHSNRYVGRNVILKLRREIGFITLKCFWFNIEICSMALSGSNDCLQGLLFMNHNLVEGFKSLFEMHKTKHMMWGGIDNEFGWNLLLIRLHLEVENNLHQTCSSRFCVAKSGVKTPFAVAQFGCAISYHFHHRHRETQKSLSKWGKPSHNIASRNFSYQTCLRPVCEIVSFNRDRLDNYWEISAAIHISRVEATKLQNHSCGVPSNWTQLLRWWMKLIHLILDSNAWQSKRNFDALMEQTQEWTLALSVRSSQIWLDVFITRWSIKSTANKISSSWSSWSKLHQHFSSTKNFFLFYFFLCVHDPTRQFTTTPEEGDTLEETWDSWKISRA